MNESQYAEYFDAINASAGQAPDEDDLAYAERIAAERHDCDE